MPDLPSDTMAALERHFHGVIRGRAGDLIDQHGVALPDLATTLRSSKSAWFPVPGMYGGFSYRLDADRPALIVESWCRVVGGSGQRHEVTPEGARLVAEGFV